MLFHDALIGYLFLYFTLLPCCLAVTQFKISKAKLDWDLKSAVLLRFPDTPDSVRSKPTETWLRFRNDYLNSKEPVVTFVAKECKTGAIIGAIDMNPGTNFIVHLAVDKNFRRLGIASALLSYAFISQREQGGTKDDDMMLQVENHNMGARKLYEKMGFELMKGTPWFYGSRFCPSMLICYTRKLG